MKQRFLAWIRLRELPDPPPGAGEDLLIFRSSDRQLAVDALRFLGKQLAALAGLLVSLFVLSDVDPPVQFAGLEILRDVLRSGIRIGPVSLAGDPLVLFRWLELAALGLFAFQFLLGALLLRLAWEVRWYQIGAESLRIREGLFKVRESTLTLANVQKLSVRRGPVQRLLGIADLEVHTAGGGAGAAGGEGEGEGDLHRVRLLGVENADGLRDRIRASRRRVLSRATRELPESDASLRPGSGTTEPAAHAAARNVLEEVRALGRLLAADRGEGHGVPDPSADA